MKSVPGTLFFKPMKEPPTVFPFGPIAELIAIPKPPYLPGEKCYVREAWCRASEKEPDGIYYPADNLLLWFTNNETAPAREAIKKYPRDGKIRSAITMPEIFARRFVTVLSCEPVRVSEVTEEDAIKLGFTFDEHNQVMARENFENDWHKRHPGKEWAWRVESEEERDVTRNNRGYGIL